MAMVSPRLLLSKWLVFMITIISTISDGSARARIRVSNKVTGFDKPRGFDKPKGAVKAIESYETGEVIDCVDIFKQPAFDHPLLKNHTIEMKPSSKQKANGAGNVEGALSQVWWKYGECPEGTIPITRPQKHNDSRVTPLTPNVKRLNLSGINCNSPSQLGTRDYATVSMTGGNYKGAHAKVNVWNPTVEDFEVSFSQVWLASGPSEDRNTVEAGLMVSAVTDPKRQAKIFIYWTSDGYKYTGCYNLLCEGFVQTSSQVALGALVQPVSTYGGLQYDITIEITKNDFTGRWWLRFGDFEVGYWPYEIFTHLKGPAKRIDWGGEIFDKQVCGIHTSTQMGSGHFPTEGFGKAAYFRNLKFVDDGSIERDPENLVMHITRPECYTLLRNVDERSVVGVNFYYGGPGYSDDCK